MLKNFLNDDNNIQKIKNFIEDTDNEPIKDAIETVTNNDSHYVPEFHKTLVNSILSTLRSS